MNNFASHLKTIADQQIPIEDLPEATEIGRLYKRTLKAREESALINTPLSKLRRQQETLEETIRTASLDSTTAEEFSLSQAHLELVSRKVRELEPQAKELDQRVEAADRALRDVQSSYSRDLNKYLEGRNTMQDREWNALGRQIVAHYSIAAVA